MRRDAVSSEHVLASHGSYFPFHFNILTMCHTTYIRHILKSTHVAFPILFFSKTNSAVFEKKRTIATKTHTHTHTHRKNVVHFEHKANAAMKGMALNEQVKQANLCAINRYFTFKCFLPMWCIRGKLSALHTHTRTPTYLLCIICCRALSVHSQHFLTKFYCFAREQKEKRSEKKNPNGRN